MQTEIGKIYEGTVKSITKYGAFVELNLPDNKKMMGMVHISEISRSFVNEIRDFVTEGQTVKAKIIGVNEAGKISLSMKQTEPERSRDNRDGNGRPPMQRRGEGRDREPRENREQRERTSNVWEPKKKVQSAEPATFEDMLTRFKQNSEERMCDIKRNTDRKNRTRRK